MVDCNRPTRSPTFIPPLSESTEIPGNLDLNAAAIAARTDAIHGPYHACISAMLDARKAAGVPTVLVAMHSFTPEYKGVARPWQIGLLYNRDARVANILHELLAGTGLTVGDNEPYAITDDSDYGIPVHGEGRGLPHIEIEIRQDLIGDEAGQRAWAQRLAPMFEEAAARVLA